MAMLRITVELVPFGEEENKRKIGEMIIINEGTHPDPERGNYFVKVNSDTEQEIRFNLKDYNRAYGFWRLIQLAIVEMWKTPRHRSKDDVISTNSERTSK